ncbi:alpha/beta fold hydrolase [Corynebacterium sp. CCM 9203]|uniref:alpha/beta fold hydrolase n=1 Tax=Corynebacterium sp. CCM 9203 TaxID=3057615 RepID=UPI0035250F16
MFRKKGKPNPPSVVALDGPWSHERVYARGMRFHVATIGHPTAPLIVLLHGAFGGWFDYREVMEPLAAAGFRVAAVDMRGYGMSDKPPREYELRYAVGDISDVIDALGDSGAIVIGSGTGGAVAWTLAANYPQCVNALISVSASHPIEMNRVIAARFWQHTVPLTRALAVRLPARLAPDPVKLARLDLATNTAVPFHRTSRFADYLELRIQAARIDNAGPAMMRNARLETAQLPAKWVSTKVEAPVLWISGANSTWRALAARNARRSVGHWVQTTVPGTKNLPHIEDPKTFTRLATGFLADQLPRR